MHFVLCDLKDQLLILLLALEVICNLCKILSPWNAKYLKVHFSRKKKQFVLFIFGVYHFILTDSRE